MAFNKNKAVESALKFLSQGKPAQAIGEYQQVLRHDPKDQATLMTVGDLFARQGDMPQAIEYFERLAQVYLNDGFNSKAIAIYKKIAKSAPNEFAPLERLADLYVQQGILSEARPLFLQIAEAHLKANRAPKAVEVLNRLLEVEPDNPRVQMRLAELYNVMGQKKEAAQTYFNYAQRLYEREEAEEAQKLIVRAIELEPGNAAAVLLEAKIYHQAKKDEKAVAALSKHPDADAGGDVTNLLVDWELASGRFEQAADRARNQLLRGSSHFGLLQKVADFQIENGEAIQSLALLTEIRDASIEAGEQDKFLKSLVAVTQKSPGNIEALETLADFSRHTSDPFQLNSSLNQLVDAYAAKGEYARAEEAVQELIDKNKSDERLLERLQQIRELANGKAPEPVATKVEQATPAVPEAPAEQLASIFEGKPAEAPAPSETPEKPLDEEAQLYIAQALTDVDLFSSYGLAQKAALLLESVLERAPGHAPSLERLLDLYVAAGNHRRTAEIAAQLERIYQEREDNTNADRLSEIREQYQKLAGLADEDLAAAPRGTTSAAASHAEELGQAEVRAAEIAEAPKAAAPEPAEFEIPVASAEVESAPDDEAPADRPVAAAAILSQAQRPAAASTTEEVDLSDEWEAMVQDAAEPAKLPESSPQEIAAPPAAPYVEAPAAEEPAEIAAPSEKPAQPQELEAGREEESIELVLDPAEGQESATEATPDSDVEAEFELSPQNQAPNGNQGAGPKTADDFLSELNAELGGLEIEEPVQPAAAPPEPVRAKAKEPVAPVKVKAAAPAQPQPPSRPPAKAPEAAARAEAPHPPVTAPMESAESLNQLSEVFQEFRSELGEMSDEEEDLETHYNLGIAYREMGLLDEAIAEFQKVAQAIQRGKPFAYAMNCAAMLALSFMDKGDPKVAALWYERALKTPGLDQESVLALRYDLGISLESAGEPASALDHFRQVYALNIDYRDVADRIAMLQKH